jgi:hypothetical protein
MSRIHDAVAKFAADFTATKKKVYADRAQSDLNKIYQDCYLSKLAEFAAWKYLVVNLSDYPQYRPDKQPSLVLLKQANWDADMQNERYKFAVKSVTEKIAQAFGLSWTFQQSKGHDPILDISDVMYKVIFVKIYNENKFLIYGASHTQALKDSGAYMFEDNIDLPKFKGIKLFVKADKVKSGVIHIVNKEIDIK